MKANPTAKVFNIRISIPTIITDVFALALIYLMPTFSHLLSFPLYLIEPMRLMLIIAIVHTHRYNAYALALTLPLFSFAIAAHPVFIKSILISVELVFMVWLYYQLSRYWNNFISIFSSIWASKVLYYGLKYLAIMLWLPKEPLVSTPLYLQGITSIIFSAYLFGVLYYRNHKQ